jgi:hypothetical protein
MDEQDYEEKPVKEVGYRKPPKAHQFRKGQSGNPRGRPRKAKKQNVPPGLAPLTADVILAEARRIVPVRDGGKVQDLDTLQALIRSLNITGLKGNRRAQVDAIKLARLAEESIEKEWAALVESVITYKLNWKEEFAYCDTHGLPRPDIVPHPDDVVLDHVNRTIIFNGPANAAEKAKWDRQKIGRDDHEWEINFTKKWCREEGADLSVFARSIALDEAMIKIHDGLLPDEETRRVPGFNIHEWRRRNGVLAQLKRDGWRSFMSPEFREPLDLPKRIGGLRKSSGTKRLQSREDDDEDSDDAG